MSDTVVSYCDACTTTAAARAATCLTAAARLARAGASRRANGRARLAERAAAAATDELQRGAGAPRMLVPRIILMFSMPLFYCARVLWIARTCRASSRIGRPVPPLPSPGLGSKRAIWMGSPKSFGS